MTKALQRSAFPDKLNEAALNNIYIQKGERT